MNKIDYATRDTCVLSYNPFCYKMFSMAFALFLTLHFFVQFLLTHLLTIFFNYSFGQAFLNDKK